MRAGKSAIRGERTNGLVFCLELQSQVLVRSYPCEGGDAVGQFLHVCLVPRLHLGPQPTLLLTQTLLHLHSHTQSGR